MNVKIKAICAALAFITVASAVSCGDSGSDSSDVSKGEASSANADNGDADSAVLDFVNAELGKDFTDIKADLKITTNRTDLIASDPDNRDFQDYIDEFTEMYPNVTIKYEGITSYDEDMTTRLTSKDWGDICSIPSTVSKSELSTYFEPVGSLADMTDKYEFIDYKSYDNKVYGVPSTGNVQGIVYNKKIWEDAGVDSLPRTPDEFITDLQLIKEYTDAIPLYTNYAAGWTLTAWDNYMSAATGDADFRNNLLPHASSPFSKTDDQSGPYAVYNILYQSVKLKLTEEDPTTTDWESSKTRINNGEIAAMVLGSWAVPQMQSAGDNADDIGYMPFPVSAGGVQYSAAAPDYCYGVNKNSTKDEKIAAMLYIKYLTEKSGYAYDNSGVPIVKGEKYPDVLEAFQDSVILVDAPAVAGEEDYYSIVNNDSELSFDSDPTHVARIIEAAETGSESFDDIINDWNERWKNAQERNGIEIKNDK